MEGKVRAKCCRGKGRSGQLEVRRGEWREKSGRNAVGVEVQEGGSERRGGEGRVRAKCCRAGGQRDRSEGRRCVSSSGVKVQRASTHSQFQGLPLQPGFGRYLSPSALSSLPHLPHKGNLGLASSSPPHPPHPSHRSHPPHTCFMSVASTRSIASLLSASLTRLLPGGRKSNCSCCNRRNAADCRQAGRV